jgi:DNA primase
LSAEQKIKVLKEVLGPFYRVGGERLFMCPKCAHHKPKLSVNLEKDSFKCWVCDYKAPSVFRLIRRYGNYNQKRQWEELTGRMDLSSAPQDLLGLIKGIDKRREEEPEEVIKLPDEFRTLTNRTNHISSVKAMRYLKSRGITKADILKWKIGYCASGEYEGRVIIPSFNMDGRVNYFIARSYGDEWIRYKNPPAQKDILFNELYVDWEGDLTLVEGVFDAIVAENAVPLLGSSLREDSRLFSKIVNHDTPLYIALDADAESKAIKLIESLLKYDMEIYKIDVSGYSDVGTMPKDIFRQRKAAAVPMDEPFSCLEHALRGLSAI